MKDQHVGVLGAGMVGSAIASDLAKEYRVTSIDFNDSKLKEVKALNSRINVTKVDLKSLEDYSKLLSPFDLVVCAVPGFMGYDTLRKIIEVGKDVVDISFFPENALELRELASGKNVTAIVDCGVAPGLSNLILGYENTRMKINSFTCYVGGLPVERIPPYEYKAPFSPIDVIEEYTRPARLYEKGKVVTYEALSQIEELDFEEIGTLEAFNSDGLRSLLSTMSHIPDMKEKTLRYPGHASKMLDLREAGFFKEEYVEQTAKVLFDNWKLRPNDDEFTIMRIELEGEGKLVTYDLLDRRSKLTGISSMSRTTGYTATAAARLILENRFDEKGLFPPEILGQYSGNFTFIKENLKERGIDLHHRERRIS